MDPKAITREVIPKSQRNSFFLNTAKTKYKPANPKMNKPGFSSLPNKKVIKPVAMAKNIHQKKEKTSLLYFFRVFLRL